ncbi:MAG TPA: glycoside hydrolase family 13 protein [Patescibacteria group bacterium]|nr:glycoside hydrolase family 13 protein [Patescibacteria group bacterium]
MTASTAGAWWRRAVVYQVYIRSFADSDGDGVGDLGGLRSRLPYLRDLGVDALWVNPWYPSPMVDGGYDVTDYRAVDPRYGTLDDVRELLHDAHDLGLRVLGDIVPNHTSAKHPWFCEALASAPGSPARARYVFRDGRGPGGDEPPNNWPSVFGGRAWTRVAAPDGTPGQWYLHLFDPGQPDLCWDNEEVRAEFESILRFWFDLGLDGFRIDVAHGLHKDAALPDLPDLLAGADPCDAVPDHPFWARPATHDVYRSWRRIADAAGGRVFVGEIGPLGRDGPARVAAYLRPDELHQAFSFDFLRTPFEAGPLRAVIDRSLQALAAVGAPATWVLSNHDVTRHATRLGRPYSGLELWEPWVERQACDRGLGVRRARAAALLMLALPGAVYLYQGEELGLDEVEDLPEEVLEDPTWDRSNHRFRGRDGCRVPIPWSGTEPPFGFGPAGATPWLPQPAAWRTATAEAQAGDPASTLELYRTALRVRRAHSGLAGEELAWLASPPGTLVLERGAGLRCAVNLSDGALPLPRPRTTLLRSDDGDGDLLPPDAAAWYVVR